MYRYWECPRCQARTATQSQAAGAFASPLCQNAACHRATMRLIGSGVAPVAPPPQPGLLQQPAALPGDVAVYQDFSTHHGRRLDWTVYRNLAEAEVRIVWTVGTSNPREARMHISMLVQGGLLEPDWVVLPPFAARGGAPACWLLMPSRNDQMERLGAFHPIGWAGPPPLTFDIRMCLGNADFGLIHMLAGHVDDMRRWTDAVPNVPGDGMQAHRTIQGLHAGMVGLLSLSNLQEIRRATGGRWIFVGADDACLVCTMMNGASFMTITTFYRRGSGARGDLYWKRTR